MGPGPGKFITFEGGEGAGKSTQVRHLAQRLRALGEEVVVTREPGGTPLAEKIRDLILADRPKASEAEFLLFSAARAEHLAAVIRPALREGKFVLCDRFIDSTRVYQGDVFGVNRELIAAVESYTVAPDMPDLTIMLDLEPSVGLTRAAERGALSRYDQARMETHEALRRGFLRIAREEPDRCVVIDGGRGEQAVADDVWQAVATRLLADAG